MIEQIAAFAVLGLVFVFVVSPCFFDGISYFDSVKLGAAILATFIAGILLVVVVTVSTLWAFWTIFG